MICTYVSCITSTSVYLRGGIQQQISGNLTLSHQLITATCIANFQQLVLFAIFLILLGCFKSLWRPWMVKMRTQHDKTGWVVVSYPLTLRVHWLVTTNPLIKYVYLECYLFQLMRCATQNRRPDWWQLHIFGIKDFICTSHLRSGVVMCLVCGGVTGHAVLRLYFILSSSAVLSYALPLQTIHHTLQRCRACQSFERCKLFLTLNRTATH